MEPCCSREGCGPRIEEESDEVFEEFNQNLGRKNLTCEREKLTLGI